MYRQEIKLAFPHKCNLYVGKRGQCKHLRLKVKNLAANNTSTVTLISPKQLLIQPITYEYNLLHTLNIANFIWVHCDLIWKE